MYIKIYKINYLNYYILYIFINVHNTGNRITLNKLIEMLSYEYVPVTCSTGSHVHNTGIGIYNGITLMV